jgi:hypothetical protein
MFFHFEADNDFAIMCIGNKTFFMKRREVKEKCLAVRGERITTTPPMLPNILVPRLFSFPFSREKKTLVGAGHVAPRIWEVKNKCFGGGDTKACKTMRVFCVKLNKNRNFNGPLPQSYFMLRAT